MLQKEHDKTLHLSFSVVNLINAMIRKSENTKLDLTFSYSVIKFPSWQGMFLLEKAIFSNTSKQ